MVRRTSALDRTAGTSISSPDSSTMPVACPAPVRIRATGASHRISAPNPRAADAMASLIDPVPPFGMPHARNDPSISPM